MECGKCKARYKLEYKTLKFENVHIIPYNLW